MRLRERNQRAAAWRDLDRCILQRSGSLPNHQRPSEPNQMTMHKRRLTAKQLNESVGRLHEPASRCLFVFLSLYTKGEFSMFAPIGRTILHRAILCVCPFSYTPRFNHFHTCCATLGAPLEGKGREVHVNVFSILRRGLIAYRAALDEDSDQAGERIRRMVVPGADAYRYLPPQVETLDVFFSIKAGKLRPPRSKVFNSREPDSLHWVN